MRRATLAFTRAAVGSDAFLTDRITVVLPAAESDLLAHADWIKGEVLAVSIEANGGSAEPQIAKA